MVLQEEKEQAQNLMRQLLVLQSDQNDLEKTFCRLRNESNELYIKLDKILDA